jgi:hypothetical protein
MQSYRIWQITCITNRPIALGPSGFHPHQCETLTVMVGVPRLHDILPTETLAPAAHDLEAAE